ncbi:hypothetical protein [Herbiconiux sp. UC225_62]
MGNYQARRRARKLGPRKTPWWGYLIVVILAIVALGLAGYAMITARA